MLKDNSCLAVEHSTVATLHCRPLVNCMVVKGRGNFGPVVTLNEDLKLNIYNNWGAFLIIAGLVSDNKNFGLS